MDARKHNEIIGGLLDYESPPRIENRSRIGKNRDETKNKGKRFTRFNIEDKVFVSQNGRSDLGRQETKIKCYFVQGTL